jgi:ABC-type antimicrobial peptide transport system permease subunit
VNDDDAVEQYWPAKLEDMPNMVVMVRASGDPASVAPMIKSISENIDPKLFPEIRQMKLLYHDNVLLLVERIATIVSMIGLIAVLVAGVGIIGLVSFSVSQRMKEIAIRMALGAKKAQILKEVLRQFVLPVAIGLVVGTSMAGAGSKVLRKVLFGVDNLDPLSYAGAIALLAVMILLATVLPARRALQLDLAKTLHYE